MASVIHKTSFYPTPKKYSRKTYSMKAYRQTIKPALDGAVQSLTLRLRDCTSPLRASTLMQHYSQPGIFQGIQPRNPHLMNSSSCGRAHLPKGGALCSGVSGHPPLPPPLSLTPSLPLSLPPSLSLSPTPVHMRRHSASAEVDNVLFIPSPKPHPPPHSKTPPSPSRLRQITFHSNPTFPSAKHSLGREKRLLGSGSEDVCNANVK